MYLFYFILLYNYGKEGDKHFFFNYIKYTLVYNIFFRDFLFIILNY